MNLFDGVRPRLIRSAAYRLEGSTRFSSSRFSVVVLGSRVSVEYFSKFLFIEAPTVTALGKFSLRDAASVPERLSADLMVVESNWFFSRFLVDSGFFLSPRVDFVLDIKKTLEAIQNCMARDKQRRFRQVAEAGYSFEVTRDLGKLGSFYFDVYLPHMLKRHSGYALPISFAECKGLFLRGELLLVKSGEELVAGNLLVPHSKELHSPVVGVSNVETHLTLGSYAAYYYSILVGIERGFERMDFGEAPPFMRDGLFQFKRDLGMWMRPARGDSAQVFGIKLSTLPTSIKSFLSAYPFIFIEDEKLTGLVFLESITDSTIKHFYVPGLTSLYILSLNTNLPNLKENNLQKISLPAYLHNKDHTLRILAKLAIENNYSLYQLNY